MLVRTIRNRGANIVVEVHGEALFAPGADIPNWKRRFSARARDAAAGFAPTNKRPRWSHYGKPLKSTFTAATRTRITKGGGFVYSAIGSTSRHAWYVDQGTGVYNNSSPYPAKILPPWKHGSGSLYERTWRPNGPSMFNQASRPVMIKGQKGQQFFDKGLKAAFRSMRMRSFQVPGEGVSAMGGGMSTFPEGLANFVGNTPADAAFITQLEEWRKWRDEAFKRGDFKDKFEAPRKSKKPTKPKPPKKPTKPKPDKPKGPKQNNLQKAIAAAKKEMANYKMRHPHVRFIGYDSEGFTVIYGTGQHKKVYWSMHVADLFAEAGAQHTAK
jgi:hypothetical protein